MTCTRGTQTLFTIVKNVTKEPDNEKMRRLKRSTKTFSTSIASAKGAVRYLRALGFEDVGEGEEEAMLLRTPDQKLLEEGKSTLKEVVKEFARRVEEQRRLENEAAAEKLRALKEISRSKQEGNEEQRAERDRQRKLLEIDRADYYRQRDPTDLR
mmetsp:Transcript_19931/g.33971  ORF Transcript_19931/g.33971 Transcript_19931/m.33971 type:complete len:155 (+) Transcript_19931:88-552(+)